MISKETIDNFKNNLLNVYNYAKSVKLENPNWYYDNKDEYKRLFDEYKTIPNKDITENEISMLAYLQLEVVNSSIFTPAKTVVNEEVNNQIVEKFLAKITGVKSYIDGIKTGNPEYIFGNEAELIELEGELVIINSNDSRILDIMNYIRTEIKMWKIAELALMNELLSIKSYTEKLKDRELHYTFDNEEQFLRLKKQFIMLNTNDNVIFELINFVENEINLSKDPKNKIVLTPEEDTFYNELKGINSYIAEMRDINPAYIFNDISKGKLMLQKFSVLKSENSDILHAMKYMIKDIIITISKNNSIDDLNAFIDYVDSIMSNSEEESLENEVTGPTL